MSSARSWPRLPRVMSESICASRSASWRTMASDGSSPLKLAVLMRIYMKMEDNLENKRNSAWLHQAEKAV
ncbi:hypothetical protein CCP4SC76_6660001 [Gammaproteobacteria bacterium]